MALKLFDQTVSIHHLGKKERGYLIVASILHDIGTSVSPRAHHKHSLYVINAQEFFHFDDVEKNIIANIARYHRRSGPKPTHPEYMRLSVTDRMTVIKLAAILRIADSLDNSGQQIVDLSHIEIRDDKLIITVTVRGNIVAEAYAFKTKRELFEDFFGIDVKLRIKRKNEDGAK
jgi:exopolyphosphatase/guanosine-5'-triphosphate,3'-diphosphate pyrophosphatase